MDDGRQADRGLREVVARMGEWRADEQYYALTLVAPGNNQRLWSAQSHYAGPSERYPGWERLAASIVDADTMTSLWEGINQTWLAVHDRLALYLWIRLGGNALVEETIGTRWLPDMVGIREVAPNGPIGFQNAGSLTAQQRRRRPTRNVGKKVARRDGNACVRCGQSPAPSVALTKHHVLPYRAGGLTQQSNLVLLCDPCHGALHTSDSWHPDPLLYGALLRHVDLDDDYEAGVQRHRRLMTGLIRKLAAAPAEPVQGRSGAGTTLSPLR
jgi:hypothetical protein